MRTIRISRSEAESLIDLIESSDDVELTQLAEDLKEEFGIPFKTRYKWPEEAIEKAKARNSKPYNFNMVSIEGIEDR